MKQNITGMRRALKRERSPRKRIFLLLSLSDNLIYSDIKQATTFSLQAIKESRESGEAELVAESKLMAGKIYSMDEEYTLAFSSLEGAAKIFKKCGDLDGMFDAKLYLAGAKDSNDNSVDALIPLHQILYARMNIQLQNASGKHIDDRLLPRTWEDRVLHRIPTEHQMRQNNEGKIGLAYNILGRAYAEFMEYEKAESLLLKGLAIAKNIKDHPLTARSFNDLGMLYLRWEKNQKARSSVNRSLKMYRRLGFKSMLAINLCNLAELAFKSKKMKEGRRLTAEASRIFLEMGLLNRASFLYIVASEYERRFGSIKKAFELNAVGLNWLKKGEKSRTYFYGLFMKLRMEFTKQPSKALFAKGIRLYSAAVKERLEIQHRIAMQLVFMAEKLHLHREWGHWLGKVHEYELHRVSEERKQEIAQLQVAHKLEKLEYDRELDKIKTRQLEAELKSKAHEIELLAAQLAKKGSFLASFKDQIESMKSSDESGMISADSVMGVIETMRYKDKEYEQLEERTQHLYKDFFVSLSKKFPDLTPAERKVCILMKLGLASKDIANVLFASVRTIENHSLSIRKKMKIPNRIRLSKFMVSL